MSLWMLVARDPTGRVVGYRFRNKLVRARDRVTCYSSPSAADRGITSAVKRWPMMSWDKEPWTGVAGREREAANLAPAAKRKYSFTRAEVWALILKDREGCARICEDEEAIRTRAGQRHPEDSESRGRCFAAARAAINCALGIRSERPKTLEELECEATPSTP